jgi:uncharacterized protein YbbC (DUF1343 family)
MGVVTERERMFRKYDAMGSLQTYLMFLVLGWIFVFSSCRTDRNTLSIKKQEKVILGAEVFLESRLDLIRGKKVGFITNPSGVDTHLQSLIMRFQAHSGIELVALYGSEHGVRGNAQAGEHVSFYVDEKFGIPVFSLYGQSQKPQAGMLKDIDESMRSFDTMITGKIPEKEMLKDLDVMIFDIQDVGTRIYVYIATMAYCMQACAENEIGFIVLDRPNPINGVDMEGPILEYPEYSSFVGLYPIPVRHGMTVGELAMLFNEEFLPKKAELTVIPMRGWKREMWFDETGLPWIIPSPNMPTLDTATVYPGQVFLEGTNISEGRGTTRPFELFGAPWIDGFLLAEKLNKLKIPGVIFREAWFTPTFSKYESQLCGGAQIHFTDRDKFNSFETSLHVIKMIKDLYPDRFSFHEDYFDSIMGTSKIRRGIEQGREVKEIIDSYAQDLTQFSEMREAYLLY